MDPDPNLDELLVKASLAAENAFHYIRLSNPLPLSDLHRTTLATAVCIRCDIIRYLVTMEKSTREGLCRLLWMADAVSKLYEAKEWYCKRGNKNLRAIASAHAYSSAELDSELKILMKRHNLKLVNKFRDCRRKVSFHYDLDYIHYLHDFSEMEFSDFEAVFDVYKAYSNEWLLLFNKVAGFVSGSPGSG